MFVEIQLSADFICRTVRNQLRSRPFCQEYNEFSIKLDPILDRIEVTNNTRLTKSLGTFLVNGGDNQLTIPGNVATITQEMNLYFVNQDDLLGNDSQQSSSNVVSLELIFNLNISLDQGQPKLSFKFVDFNKILGSLPWYLSSDNNPDNTEKIKNILSEHAPPERILDISGLISLLPLANPTITNAGITTDVGIAPEKAPKAVLFRLEFGGVENVFESWMSFYNNSLNQLDANDWALIIDKDILCASISNVMLDNYALVANRSKFVLKSDIVTTWQNDFVQPKFLVEMSGEIKDACLCAASLSWVDIDVNVWAVISLSIPSTNNLHVRVDWNFDKNDTWDYICCALTASLLWPIAGLFYISEGKVTLGEYFLAELLGPILRLIGFFVIVQAAESTLSNQTTQNLAKKINSQKEPFKPKCYQTDEKTLECDVHVPDFTTGALGGKISIEGISGIANGLVVRGTIKQQEIGIPSLKVSHTNLNWSYPLKCDSGYSWTQDAMIVLENQGQGPLQVGKALLIKDPKKGKDPKKVFSIGSTMEWYGYTDLQPGESKSIGVGVFMKSASINDPPHKEGDGVHKEVADQTYFDDPYTCNVFVITSAGIRHLNLGYATNLDTTPAEEKIKHEQVTLNKIQCFNSKPWSENRWWRWPEEPAQRIYQLWNIIVKGIDPDEKVALMDEKKQPIMTSNPYKGAVFLSALFEPNDQQSKVWLKFENSHESNVRKIAKEQPYSSTRQVSFVKAAEIPLNGGLLDMKLNLRNRRYFLDMITTKTNQTFDLSAPNMPFLVGVGKNIVKPMFERFSGGFIRKDLAKNELVFLDNLRNSNRCIEVNGFFNFLVVDDYIYVISESSLQCINAKDSANQQFLQEQELINEDEEIRKIQFVKLPSVRKGLYIESKKYGKRLLDLSKSKSEATVAEFLDTPWFVDTVSAGNLLIKLAPSKESLIVLRTQNVVNVGGTSRTYDT